MLTVSVALGDRSYDVLVGRGARHRLLEVLPLGAARAAVVTQERIGVPVDAGIEQRTFLMGAGETAKDLETVEDLCRQFSRWGLTRGDVVVAVGGGGVTDTAGFAAAVYHRGVRWSPCRQPSSARWMPRSAARPASTSRKARTWWAPSGSRRPCCATPRCSKRSRPASTAAGWVRWRSTTSSVARR